MAAPTASVLSQCQTVAGPATRLASSDAQALGGSLSGSGSSLVSAARPCRRAAGKGAARPLTVCMARKKAANSDRLKQADKSRAVSAALQVNAYDDNWTKGFFSSSYFSEGGEKGNFNIIKTLEKKKLLTGIEKAGLLSKLESLGLKLSTVEKLGLLSKAESLGLLGALESFAAADPAALASLSLPLFVGAIAFPILIPDDSAILLIVQYTLAALSGAAATGLFLGSVALGILQED